MSVVGGGAVVQVVYDGPNVQVLHLPGREDLLIEIFSPKGTPIGDSHFWGRGPAEKLGFAAIGIVAKGPTWYPWVDMEPVLAAIGPIAARYGARLAVGSSMGGYAALKYGRAIGATTCLAYGPQSTIVPAEMDERFNPFVEFYREEMHQGMAVTAADVPEHVICVYDPGVEFDRRAVERIAAVAPWTSPVMVPNVGHEVIRPFAATDVFGTVVDLAVRHDVEGFRRLAQVRRRLPGQRTLSIVRNSIVRRPMLAYDLFLREVVHFPPRDARDIALALGGHFLRHASPGKARTVFRAGLDRLGADAALQAAWDEADAIVARVYAARTP